VVLSAQIRGEGRPLVLLPWFGLDHAVMAAAFEPVFTSATGWRRIYVDLPGTEESPPVDPCSDAVLDAVTDTVGSILGEAPFLLAGCSYGGYLSAGLVRRVPAQVAGLLMVCAGVKIRPDQRDLSRVLPPTPESQWLHDVPGQLHEHFSAAIGHQTGTVANRIAHAFGLNAPTNDEYLGELRSNGYQLSDEGSPQRFDGNVMMLTGRRDRIAGYLDQFDALARYGRGDFVALGDAGHYLPFEQPERFRSAALDWLARSARPSAGSSAVPR
jgi:pimeloyl-ACP methyl ester carboxylesterase